MSEEMSSWRSLASAASRSIKGYVSQRDLKRLGGPEAATANSKQSWGQWAGQKLRRGNIPTDTSLDSLSLFPGWAARRYHQSGGGAHSEEAPFDMEVYVSGYAARASGPGFGSRAGRTFLGIAKRFAALPRIEGQTAPNGVPADVSSGLADPLLRTKNIHLPPPPDAITDELEMAELEKQLRELEQETASTDSTLNVETDSSASDTSPGPSMRSVPLPSSIPPSTTPPSKLLSIGPLSTDMILQWHANLEARLLPFWSSALSGRIIRLSLYAADPLLFASDDEDNYLNSANSHARAVATTDVLTIADGSFQVKFRIPWEQMCVHPGALQIAFGDPLMEQEVFITAQLLSPPSSEPSVPGVPQAPKIYSAPVPTASAAIHIPLTHSSIRVISDIDDTIKRAGVIQGARAVFRNVFARDLRDIIIPGMGEWYTGMWRRGVRFHYVSNGPFALLPVINEFFQISQLPMGSVKLRSYAGRSLFNGFLSAPAVRKRANVLEVLNNFADSRFFLVGDSGEQDLELYASFAKERPDQILAVFVRDVTEVVGQDSLDGALPLPPLDDPTGAWALSERKTPGLKSGMRSPSRPSTPSEVRRKVSASPVETSIVMQPTPKYPVRRPSRSLTEMPLSQSARGPIRALSVNLPSPREGTQSDYFSAVRTASPVDVEPSKYPPVSNGKDSSGYLTASQSSSTSTTLRGPPLSEAERKRNEMQMRVWKARTEIPPHIPLRIFRTPEECVEANAILDKLHVGSRPGETLS